MTLPHQANTALPAAQPSPGSAAAGDPAENRLSLTRSVVEGLSSSSPSLDYRLLYDAEGSRLFERITELPEYYQTRLEAGVLGRHAAEIAALAGPVPLVEFGAGSGKKTSLLIEAFEAGYGAAHYVPVDVSEAALESALRGLTPRHPRTRISPVHGVHETALALLEILHPSLGVFLGSSIGNFTEAEERCFYAELGRRLKKGGAFLLGVDLVKDPKIIERAYNDSAGITASFVANLFRRLRRELGAEVDMEGFRYQARYRGDLERVEIHASFAGGLRLGGAGLHQPVEVPPERPILVEICRKFRVESVESRLWEHGLRVEQVFLDEQAWFADLLITHR